MQEVPADVCDAFMHTSNTNTRLVSVHGLRQLAGKAALLSAELALELLQRTWGLRHVAVAVRAECP